METRTDSAVVPWIWQLEVSNAPGKAVVKGKVPLRRALDIWNELSILPIRQAAVGGIPQLLKLAVEHNLSVYDTCYLQTSLASGLPLAANDYKLRDAAVVRGIRVLTP